MGRWGEDRTASQGSTPHPILQEERSAIARARHFLESSAPLAADPYSSALTTYALTLLRSPAAPAALRKLRSLAITQGRGPPPATPEATVGPTRSAPQYTALGHMRDAKRHPLLTLFCYLLLYLLLAPFDEVA